MYVYSITNIHKYLYALSIFVMVFRLVFKHWFPKQKIGSERTTEGDLRGRTSRWGESGSPPTGGQYPGGSRLLLLSGVGGVLRRQIIFFKSLDFRELCDHFKIIQYKKNEELKIEGENQDFENCNVSFFGEAPTERDGAIPPGPSRCTLTLPSTPFIQIRGSRLWAK